MPWAAGWRWPGRTSAGRPGDRLVGLALQLVLAVPALLLLAAGVATP